MKYNLHKCNCCNPIWIETYAIVSSDTKKWLCVFLQGKISNILDSFLKKSVVRGVKIFDREVEE